MKTARRQTLIVLTFVCAVTLIAMLPVGQAWAQSSDPAIGKWELNLAKSQFHPGPAPRAQTRTYEILAAVRKLRVAGVDAEGKAIVVEFPVPYGTGVVRMTAKEIDAEGKPTLMEYTAIYDGKDYPFIGNPNADTISLKRIDDFTVEATTKKAGKVVSTGRRVISTDGKVMTIAFKGTNAKGQTVNNTLVFDKR